jgi:DNA repair exonuclease SbcCD ATPase subunit
VAIETQRLAADGKRMLEGCEVRVLDSERGRDAAAESLSGGERVIVGEAVSLALTTLACRRQGVERPTLVRDESGAALDAGNARVYVAMLRRAAELVRADKVLLVSHSAEVQELCDSRVRVAGGSVEVE